jgi:hypothetical protein
VSKKKLTSDEKHSDYHALLNVVLSPLAVLQTYNGLAWKMDYNDVLFEVILKIPILFICGDSEGQHKLVGRRMINSSGSGTFNGHIWRYCDVPYEATDNPFYDGKLTKASDIARFLAQQRIQMISGMGYLNVEKNALHQLQFCDRTHGLNRSGCASPHVAQISTWYLYICFGRTLWQEESQRCCSEKKKRVIRQHEREQEESDQSNESDSATINTQGKNLMHLKCLQEICLMLQNVTSSIQMQGNMANYFHDNLIEIYHVVISQVV